MWAKLSYTGTFIQVRSGSCVLTTNRFCTARENNQLYLYASVGKVIVPIPPSPPPTRKLALCYFSFQKSPLASVRIRMPKVQHTVSEIITSTMAGQKMFVVLWNTDFINTFWWHKWLSGVLTVSHSPILILCHSHPHPLSFPSSFFAIPILILCHSHPRSLTFHLHSFHTSILIRGHPPLTFLPFPFFCHSLYFLCHSMT